MANIQHNAIAGSDLHEDKRVKIPVRAASTANVTLATPGTTLDGVTLSNGDRVLLKNQTAPAENGIYTWTASATALVRTTDADAATELVHGFLTFVREGTSNAATLWLFTQTAAITLNTTALTFIQVGAASGTFAGEVQGTDFKATGLTGATAASRMAGATASGAPGSGTFAVGDFIVDQTGKIWICTTAGSPGTWTQVSGSGGGGGGGGGSGIGAPTVPDMFQQTNIRGTGNKTTSSTSFVAIDGTNLPALSMILSVGDVVRCMLAGQVTSGSGSVAFDFQVVQPTLGTTRVNNAAASGAAVLGGNQRDVTTVIATFTAAEAGAHTFQTMWLVSSGTATLSNATSGLDDTEVLFSVEKIGAQLTLPYVMVQDRKTQNTAGGTFTSGADRTRDLNTEVEDTHSIASLASNQITLPVGTYRIHAIVPSHEVDRHQALLYNVTDAAELLRGSSAVSGAADASDCPSFIVGRFTLTGTKALEIRHRCQTTHATNGLGLEANFSTEIYTSVQIWKEV